MSLSPKIRLFVYLVIISAALSTGVSGCFFVAWQAVYPFKSCPPVGFALPTTVKSDSFEISQHPFIKAKGPEECRKLVRYWVIEKSANGGSSDPLDQYEVYLGILRNDGCSLVASVPRRGNAVPNSEIQELIASTEKGILAIIGSTPFSIDTVAKKVTIIKGAGDYQKWCDNLPISNSSTNEN